MAGKFSEPQYKPQVRQAPYPPDFGVENDLDYTSPYPCGVCGRNFTSRTALATHPHRERRT